jgi:hypothetical protein
MPVDFQRQIMHVGDAVIEILRRTFCQFLSHLFSDSKLPIADFKLF